MEERRGDITTAPNMSEHGRHTRHPSDSGHGTGHESRGVSGHGDIAPILQFSRYLATGGLSASDDIDGKLLDKHPERLIELAVKGMLPKGPLGRQMHKKLKVYAGPKHPHEAQSPQHLELSGAVRAR